MVKSLDGSLSLFRDKISDSIKSGRSVSVTTHIDCDGLASGSIIAKALIRAGAKCTVRALKEFDKNVVESFKTNSRNLHIITDLGGGFADQLEQTLKDDWIVLDHHQISDQEIENQNVINSWKYGIDGGMEICAGGMAYLASMAIDEKNSDLSAVAVIAALGDRQDQGEKRSLTGKNFEIANVAKEQELLEIDVDLLLVGRETKPLAEALASTSQTFIEGLTWNKDACLALLKSSKIKLKDKGRWRVPAELNESEKSQVVESLTEFTLGKDVNKTMPELIGYAYTFPREDKKRFLRDGREFSTMLNACGSSNHSGIGIAVCMGDRGEILNESENVLMNYRETIREYVNILSNQRWRILEDQTCIMINAEDVVQETMTGTVASLMARSPKNSEKIIILRAKGADNTIKFSLRKGVGCKSDINLSNVTQRGAEKFKGIGGGHNAAAGAKISRDKLEEFLKYLEVNVVNMHGATNSQ